MFQSCTRKILVRQNNAGDGNGNKYQKKKNLIQTYGEKDKLLSF